jgi:hypothetical protein
MNKTNSCYALTKVIKGQKLFFEGIGFQVRSEVERKLLLGNPITKQITNRSARIAGIGNVFPAALTNLAPKLTASEPILKLPVIQAAVVLSAWNNYLHQQTKREEVKIMDQNQNTVPEMDLTQTELPKDGIQPGVFVGTVNGTRTNKRKRVDKTLTLLIELAQLRTDGNPFIVEIRYVLDTRGQRKLRANVEEFDASLSQAGALRKFNPHTYFPNKPCQGTVGYVPENGRTVAKALKYQVAVEPYLLPSGKHVRDQAATPVAAAAPAETTEQPVQSTITSQ